MIGIVSIIIICCWAMYFFSIISESEYLIWLASAGLLVMAVYIMVNGLEGINNWVTVSFAVIQIGAGMIGIVSPYLNLGDDDSTDNSVEVEDD